MENVALISIYLMFLHTVRRSLVYSGALSSSSRAFGLSRPARRSACLKRNSICALTLRSSSAAQRSIALYKFGSIRSRNAFRLAKGTSHPLVRRLSRSNPC